VCLIGCGVAPAATPPANRGEAATGRTYAALFESGRTWELPCETRAYLGSRREDAKVTERTTLHCRSLDAQTVGAAKVAHVTCDDDIWVDAQLTGWYLADARGLWKLDNEVGPQDMPIMPGGDPDHHERITAADVPKLREDHMLVAANPAARKIDEPGIAEGMRLIVDVPVDAAWCVRQVSSYGGAPNWRAFCYEDGKGLVGASYANGEQGRDTRCGIAPMAEFDLGRRP